LNDDRGSPLRLSRAEIWQVAARSIQDAQFNDRKAGLEILL
jgi:hypothetical protein